MRKAPPSQRFWAKVSGGSYEDCWVWTGALIRGPRAGYGTFHLGKNRMVRAHRWAYEELIGPIPDGLDLDHLCRNRACVNPWHLDPVTRSVNVRRGISPAAEHAAKSECPQGHPYDEANTYHANGRRYCRTCKRGHDVAYYRRQRAFLVAAGSPSPPS